MSQSEYRGPARRARRHAKPEKTEAEKAAEQYEAALIEAGGNLWISGDLSKRRIYFNDVTRESDGRKMSVYYDAIAEKWQTGKYAYEFVQILRDQINL